MDPQGEEAWSAGGKNKVAEATAVSKHRTTSRSYCVRHMATVYGELLFSSGIRFIIRQEKGQNGHYTISFIYHNGRAGCIPFRPPLFLLPPPS